MPELHVPTLFAALALVQFAAIGFAAVLYRARFAFPGAGVWIFGQAMFAVAGLTLIVRPELPPMTAVLLSNVPFIVAAVLFLHSLWVFRFDQPFSWWVYLIIPAATALFFVDTSADVRFRSVLFSALLGTIPAAVGIVAVYRQSPPYRLPAYLLGGTFFLIAASNFARIPGFLGPDPVAFYEQTDSSKMVIYFSILAPLLILFGYYLLSTTRFIQEQERRNRQLESQNQRLNRMTDTMGILLSVIGHDVKTPLAAAHRYVARFLYKAPDTLEKKREQLHVLEQTLEYSRTLLDDLTTFARAKIDQHAPVAHSRASIREVIELARRYVSETASRKSVTIDTSSVHSAGLVAGEEQWLAIMLRNLLLNAVKFSHPGSVVTILVEDDESGTRVTVRDHGTGMPARQIDAIEKKGIVPSTLGTNSEKGSGIGLAVVNALCDRMGIKLHVRSTEGVGTDVVLNIPRYRDG